MSAVESNTTTNILTASNTSLANTDNISELTPKPSDSTLEQGRYVGILNQIVPFVLHTSYYMTDLIYTLYYVANTEENMQEKNTEKSDALLNLKTELCSLVVKLRTRFRNLLDECDLNDPETPIVFRNLIDKNIISILYQVNDILTNELGELSNDHDSNFNGLIIQLQNCFNGFGNLFNFVKKMPLQRQYKVTSLQLDVLITVVRNDLLPTWKTQLDLLNCKLFDDLSRNQNVVSRYREATNDRDSDVKEGES